MTASLAPRLPYGRRAGSSHRPSPHGAPIAVRISPPRDWEAIARDYAARELSVDALCALHGLSQSTLYYRVCKESWPYRVPRRTREQNLGQRLLDALDRKMTEFESRHLAATAQDAAPSAADAERDARTLNTLVRLFDKLQGRSKKPAGRAAPAAAAPALPGAHDTDSLRGVLARRLEALRTGADA